MNESKKKIAVVGAGIAGLTCAYELQKAGFNVTVFEKEDVVGGRMASREKDGLIFDIGADHLCNLYTEMKKYCSEFDIVWEKMRFLKYGVTRDKKIVSPYESIGWISRARLAFQYFRTRNIADFFELSNLIEYDTEDAQTYMKRRIGSEAVNYLIDSFTSTYQFHKSDEISVGALLGIMHSVKKDTEKWYLHRTKGGMSALPEAFANRLNVRTSTPVTKIIAGDRIIVTTNHDEEFDLVIIASPANITNQIYKNPTPPQTEILNSTKYATTISTALRVDRDLLKDFAIVWVPFVESEAVSGYVNEAMKGEETIKDGKSLVSVWLHEDFAKSIIDKSDSEIFKAVKKEFLSICPWFTSLDELESFDLHRWPEAMPKFSRGHLTHVKNFIENGQGDQNVFFVGDYLNSPWTEGALRGGQRTAKRIIQLYKDQL